MAKTTSTTPKDRVYKRKRRRRQATAVVFLLLALVGTVTIVTVLVRFVNNTFFDNTKEKERFETLIAPMVALDPVPFSSLDNADQNVLLEAAIFGALAENDLSKYEQTDYGLYLPRVDVTRAAANLYGSSYTLTHKTFRVAGIEYKYDAATERYFIPSNSQIGSYYPVIVDIDTSGNTKTLLVAYTQVSVSDNMVAGPSSTRVVKYMEYLLVKEGGNYHLYSVRETDREGA